MRALLAPALLWTSAIGCGLMAGVYFAFSAFIMTSLGRIAPAAGMAAMNATIVDIVKSPFIPVFMLTTLTAASLAVLGIMRWGQPGSALMVMGGVVYVLGMFVVTMAVNQPMNQALLGIDPASPAGCRLLVALRDRMDDVEPCPHRREHHRDGDVYRCPHRKVMRSFPIALSAAYRLKSDTLPKAVSGTAWSLPMLADKHIQDSPARRAAMRSMSARAAGVCPRWDG
ncbi:MAG: anthrone oxygenase family protein [Sphingomonas sp.]|jgi:uncharacterized membrane protein|uniref:anthrone oxygenase family protein n=1 Tax=Sphingomonas sp. TaxID=28214 RepID=UPI0035657E9D